MTGAGSLWRYVRPLRAAGWVGVLWWAGGCSAADIVAGIGDVDNADFVVSESFAFTVELTTQSRFRLEGINGTVRVTGAPGATAIDVTGERRVGSSSTSDALAHLPNLRVELEERGSEIVVRTIQPQNARGRAYIVDYVVTLPAELTPSIGNVNGEVFVSAIDSDVAIGSVNGNVTADGVHGDLSVGLVNGNVMGDVTLAPGGSVSLDTVNGNIGLLVPVDVSARLEANWVNGSFSVDNLTLLDQVITQNSATGVFGDGNGTISLGVTNGALTITGR